MRKGVFLLVAAVFGLALSACQSVSPSESQSYLRLKCPACGYEFDAPNDR